MTNASYCYLQGRAAVRMDGDEAEEFLQSFVTQDVRLLREIPLLYGAMLNAQGRMEHDFFLSKEGTTLVLETESARAENLAAHLSMFRLRRKIELKVTPVQVLALWGAPEALKAFPYPKDPRNIFMGLRKTFYEHTDLIELNSFLEAEQKIYHKLCIDHAVPSGSFDIAWGEDTPADVGLDRLNGVSYAKGCYLGQETTSRMHHRGLGKKSLYPVRITGAPLPPFTDILAGDDLIGEMRSAQDESGLALLRHDCLHLTPKAGLEVLPPG